MDEIRSRAEAIRFELKDRPLRRDVGRLGALLGNLLRELAPAGIYEIVEAARLLSRKRRKGDAAAGVALASRLSELSPTQALEVVRAFSAYFGVVNMAEQVHRLRPAHRLPPRCAKPSQEAYARWAATLVRRGTTAEEVSRALSSIVVEPVFTAHPTEPVRRTLLKKDQRLARALVEGFQAETLDPVAREKLEERVALEVASAWQTEEQLPGRPTVAEEVEHVLFFLSEVLYRVVPALHEELERSLTEAYGRRIAIDRPVLRFASWVGGDMDGNPNVGAKTIQGTLARHLELALRRYREELRTLHEHLSHSTTRVEIDEAVVERVRHYAEQMPQDFVAVPERYAQMPYRQLLWLMSARLERKGRNEEGGYGPPEEFRADLELLKNSLMQHRGTRSGLALVRRALWRVEVFGFHLAALDVRQDARVHRRVAGVLLGDAEFSARSAKERTARIGSALHSEVETLTDRLDLTAIDEESRRVLAVFRALADARRRYGPSALGPYIVSMARGPDDALAVLLLARIAGCVDAEGRVPFDVAPLFETVDDLREGPDTLRALATDEVYASHLAARHSHQMVMLGYSDSNKDGGIASSRVALDRAQEQLVVAAADLGLRLTLFQRARRLHQSRWVETARRPHGCASRGSGRTCALNRTRAKSSAASSACGGSPHAPSKSAWARSSNARRAAIPRVRPRKKNAPSQSASAAPVATATAAWFMTTPTSRSSFEA